MKHVVQVGRNEHSFPLHLLDAETLNTGHIPDMLEIVGQAVRSPFSRSTVVFLCPDSQQTIVRDTLMFAVRELMEKRDRGIQQISIKILSRTDPRLPQGYLGSTDAPLVCFSIARLSCLTAAMAMANISYRGMQFDFANWLHTERLAEARTYEESDPRPGPLSEHGSWIEAQLLNAGYPWHYPLLRIVPLFHQFVRRCERLPEVTGHASFAAGRQPTLPRLIITFLVMNSHAQRLPPLVGNTQMAEIHTLHRPAELGDIRPLHPPWNSIASHCRALATRMLVDGAKCPDLVMPEEPSELAARWRSMFEENFIPQIITFARTGKFTWQCEGTAPDALKYFKRVFRFNGFPSQDLANGRGVSIEW